MYFVKRKEYIRKIFVCLLLTAYVFGILKPLSPIINDLIGHTLNKANHMATVHFENGKYHVHKELVSETKNDSEQNKTKTNFSSEKLLSTHLHSNSLYSFSILNETSVIHNKTNIRHASDFFKTFNPPPKA